MKVRVLGLRSYSSTAIGCAGLTHRRQPGVSTSSTTMEKIEPKWGPAVEFRQLPSVTWQVLGRLSLCWIARCFKSRTTRLLGLLSEWSQGLINSASWRSHRSGIGAPPSACFRTVMIYASLQCAVFTQNLLRYLVEKIRPLNITNPRDINKAHRPTANMDIVKRGRGNLLHCPIWNFQHK